MTPREKIELEVTRVFPLKRMFQVENISSVHFSLKRFHRGVN